MVFRDKRFLLALGCTLSQQVMLALSTYYIALAGACLALGNTDRVLSLISLFFTFALLAYIASSIATLFSTRAANRIWKKYASTTLRESTQSLQYASVKNSKSIAQWLGAEALPTIAHACDFYLGMASVALNIVLTLAVFYVTVGWKIASAIAASLLVSFALVVMLRHTIEISAGAMQQRRQDALLSIEPTWTASLFGNRKMRDAGLRSLDKKTQRYFREINRYVLLEQFVACGPIIISTMALIGLLQFTDLLTASIAGALVALLPRSLQVFGNVHALSIYLSQFFLIRAKLRNLDGFCAGLDRYVPMHEAPLQSVSVWDSFAQKEIQPADLLKKLQSKGSGRYLVTGENGSGKSTLLKIIKDRAADAILVTPETHFLESRSDLSTGQRRLKEIENALSMDPPVLMLDEWDANLDEDNCGKIDLLLEQAAKRMVVIEVRHLRPGVHSNAQPWSFDMAAATGPGRTKS
ncbi:hypothetical protein [Pantoea sp. 18069]|uniref:hypothetical protein n=1 Tax=Pantoea sp. 18069 TaxID=2681415 RepID=UPI00190F23C8|nr:hypothetical protein [Pantoea sp. 18069]